MHQEGSRMPLSAGMLWQWPACPKPAVPAWLPAAAEALHARAWGSPYSRPTG